MVEPRDIAVLDRMGGGGFVGGMLYAILRGWEPATWVRFGWTTGALATNFLTDYAQIADEGQVWAAGEGRGDGVPRTQTWGCGLPTSPRTFGACGYAVDAARPRRHPSPERNDMTPGQVATVLALAAGFLGVLAVGFFTGFANTWPIIIFVLGGTFLINRN